MSTKPDVTLARWADLAGSFVTDAPSGLRDTGFLDGTPLEADIVNAELKQFYLWAKYLSDGALSGNHSIAGGLSVTAASSFGAALTVNGTLTVNAGVSLGTFDDFDIDGSNGTVTIKRQLLMAGTATYAGTKRLQSTSIAAPATGNNNNYALPTQPVLSLTGTTGSPVITGMIAVSDGHVITIVNNGAASIQFTHQDTNSTAGNRLQLPGAATLTLAQHGIVTFMYGTGGFNAWRVVSKNF